MAIQPMALAVANPEINAVQAMSEGVNASQQAQSNQLTIAKQSLQNIGSMAFGVMGGKIDGQADPQMWEQSLDMLAGSGMNVDQFRGRPDLAPIVARASVDTLGQLNLAQNEKELELRLQEFAQKVGDAGKPGAETYFGNIVYMTDPTTGKIIAGQASNHGNFKPIGAADGLEPAVPVQQLNTGTGFTGVDKFGNQTGETTAIDNFGAAFDTQAGKDAAAKIQDLPKTLAQADNMLASIDGILSDPALDSSTGWLSFLQGVPGTEQYRFGQRALQLQGQAFLQAFESLKGGGQITEIEGSKAEQAIARLSTAQSADDYRAALDELKGIITAAKGRAAQTATAPRPQAPGSTPAAASAGNTRLKYNPATGELE